MLAIRVVGAGAVVLGGALGIDDEQQTMIGVDLNAAGRAQGIYSGELQAAAAAAGCDRLDKSKVAVAGAVINLNLIVVQGVGHRVDRPVRPGRRRGGGAE